MWSVVCTTRCGLYHQTCGLQLIRWGQDCTAGGSLTPWWQSGDYSCTCSSTPQHVIEYILGVRNNTVQTISVQFLVQNIENFFPMDLCWDLPPQLCNLEMVFLHYRSEIKVILNYIKLLKAFEAQNMPLSRKPSSQLSKFFHCWSSNSVDLILRNHQNLLCDFWTLS